ncbi:MAG: imm11 family protein [Flavobacterium sp.]
MQFYSIKESLNIKIIGKYTQSEKAKYNCDVWHEPKFIEHIHQQKIDFEPIVANAILSPKAMLTDLISVVGMGFTRKLLMSDKLKGILEEFGSDIQFFRDPLFYKGDVYENYWILNAHNVRMDFIDYQKSEVYLTENVFNMVRKLTLNSYKDFLENKKAIETEGYPKGIYVERIKILPNVDNDFFTLINVEGGVKYVVSEKLKTEIESAGCSGIEFQPVEMTLNEWLAPGGPREQIYGKI